MTMPGYTMNVLETVISYRVGILLCVVKNTKIQRFGLKAGQHHITAYTT
jgi:hypothetical protein